MRAHRGRVARVQREPPRRGDEAARRDPPGRHRPRRASGRSRAPRRGRGSGWTPPGRYLLFPHDPSRPLKRYDRARGGGGRRAGCSRSAASRRTRCRTGSTPPTPCSCPSAEGGVRALGDRGARLRRAGARHAGRHPSRRARRESPARYCAPWDRDAWRAALQPAPRRARSARRRAAPAPSCSPPTRWPSASWQRVARPARRAHLTGNRKRVVVRCEGRGNRTATLYSTGRGPSLRRAPPTHERPVPTLVQPALRWSRRQRAHRRRRREPGRAEPAPAEAGGRRPCSRPTPPRETRSRRAAARAVPARRATPPRRRTRRTPLAPRIR